MSDLEFGCFSDSYQPHLVDRIEQMGYDSVWMGEHVFFYGPTVDALTVLSSWAARTTRIKLGTSVFLLPLRPAPLAAKQAATVDVISGGRLILGVGVGGEYPKEFTACGVPVNERGARTNEAIAVLKRLWNEDEVHFQGRFTQLDGVTLMPKPTQKGGPPIWVGGRSPAARRRAARLADGYYPYLVSPNGYRACLTEIRQLCEGFGRDPASITPAVHIFICLADSYAEAKETTVRYLSAHFNQDFEKIADRYIALGSAEDCARRIADFAEAGARHFVLCPVIEDGDERSLNVHAEAYAREILPRLR